MYFKCQKYGHYRESCRGHPACGKCGQNYTDHMAEECTSDIKYSNFQENQSSSVFDILLYIFSIYYYIYFLYSIYYYIYLYFIFYILFLFYTIPMHMLFRNWIQLAAIITAKQTNIQHEQLVQQRPNECPIYRALIKNMHFKKRPNKILNKLEEPDSNPQTTAQILPVQNSNLHLKQTILDNDNQPVHQISINTCLENSLSTNKNNFDTNKNKFVILERMNKTSQKSSKQKSKH